MTFTPSPSYRDPGDEARRAFTSAAREAVAAGVRPHDLVVGILSAIHGYAAPGAEGYRLARGVAELLVEGSLPPDDDTPS